MKNLWRCLEALPGLVAVPSVWADGTGAAAAVVRTAFLRDTGRLAEAYPCECGCAHAVVEHEDGRMVGVCQCEPWNCDDVALSREELKLLEFNRAKFGREVCRAFGCEPKRPPVLLPPTWEAGVFAGLSVFLTMQYDAAGFQQGVGELTARLRQPFILLAPTGRFLGAESKALLATARAGFFDLETHLVLTPAGTLQARKPAGELFARYLPDAPEVVPEDLVRQLFGVIEKFESNRRLAAPSVLKVFLLYCGHGLSAEEVAVKCGCSKGTVMGRLKLLRLATGKAPEALRAYSPYLQKAEEDLTDDRARHIHRKAQVHGLDDSEDEKE
jgi:hypothetical protein